MSDKYFKELEFPELQKDETPTLTPEEADVIHEDLTDMLTEVRRIIAGVISGESSLVSHGIQLNKNTPCMVGLERLEKTPTRSNLHRFLTVSRQDIGLAVSTEFARIFDEILNPAKKEKK